MLKSSLILFFGLVANVVAVKEFYLKAQTYGDSDGSTDPDAPPQPALYMTRYGYLTTEKKDADEYAFSYISKDSEDQTLITFPKTPARSQRMGIFETDTTTMDFTCIRKLPKSKLPKVTTSFSIYESDDGEILVFENESFNNSDSQAVFVIPKSRDGLEGQRVQVVTEYKKLDWKEFVLADLIVEAKAGSGDDDEGNGIVDGEENTKTIHEEM